ncbi:MAG: RluA family pseudouridine synthase [Prevotellaceae bacterium]|jgi:23S rRNA pseudouridine1911/1915/1917 synthase|nr:RluA family pseudouridine synthase [Prevotellaceae bacterium]
MNNEVENIDAADELEEQGLYEHHSLTADKGQSLLRVDKFLTNRLEHVSRNRVQNAADAGNILVNGVPVKSSYKVKPLDVVSVVMPYPPREVKIIPENIPLNIVYEDDDLMVVNKAAGMVVHPGVGNDSGTLVNALTYHLQSLPMFQTGDLRAGLVHRIDKDTSGILVVAKTELAHNRLAKQFFDHTINRLYVAMVWGVPNPAEGTITGHLARSLRDKIKMQVFPDGDKGKHAITHYRVLEDLGYVSMVECKLETGRTHQIRAHMEHIGHPLFNDEKYGGSEILRGTTFTKYKQFVHNCFAMLPRQALHAKVLGFIHPITQKEMHFEAPLPADMEAVAEKWRKYVDNRGENAGN